MTTARGGRIASRPRPDCPLCGARGELRYRRLTDRLYSAPGEWNLAMCRACQVLWLDPVPTEEDIGKAYATYYTHVDGAPPRARPLLGLLQRLRRAYLHQAPAARGALRVFPGGRDAMDDTVCHLPPAPPGGSLLEVGCGRGAQLVRMVERGWEVTGVDTDPVAVAAARSRGLDVRHGELAGQDFPDSSFHAVYMSHVVEHVHDPVALLRECERVLAPGGRLVAITPNAASQGHRIYDSAWFGLEPPRHLVVFAPAAVLAAARAAGLAAVRARTSARIAFIVSIGSRDIRRCGRVVSFDGPVPPARLARGALAQVAQAAALTRRPWAGEEIILTARKSVGSGRP